MSMRSSPRRFFLAAAAVCIALTALVARRLGSFLSAYPMWLLCCSVSTFLFYGFDKAQSRRGGWRVPEAVLHLLSLAGGFLGALRGRQLFRHKTQKPAFLVVIVLSAALHLTFALWLLTRRG